MKKMILGFALLLSTSSFAGNGHVYLGGSTDVQSCANYAGSLGFSLGVFGAGFDNNGTYYPFFNACFGLGRSFPQPQPQPLPQPLPQPIFP